MKITFKLYAMLTDYLPPEARSSNRVELDIAPESSIADIIAPYGMPMKMVHLVLINGHYIAPEDRATRTLKEGDVLGHLAADRGRLMQPHYAASFERDTAGTEAEWLGRLDGACAPHRVTLGDAHATVEIGEGRLALAWQPLPPRRIALMEFARMLVSYRFDALPEAERERFMLRFDMYMQRGGG